MVEMVARCAAAAASRAAADFWVVWRRAEIGKIMAIFLFGGMAVLNVAAAALMISTAMTMNGGEIR